MTTPRPSAAPTDMQTEDTGDPASGHLSPMPRRPRLQPQTPPPAGYYGDNLLKVLGFLLEHRACVFDAAERRLMRSILKLREDAQRLLARLLGRRGPVFLTRSLAYAEVGNLALAIADLHACAVLAGAHSVAADRVLDRCLKRELAMMLPAADQATASGARKAELVNALCVRYSDAALRAKAQRLAPYIVLGQQPLLRRIELMYFGAGSQWREPWAAFVLEDLGTTRFYPYELSSEGGQFPDRAALETYLRLRALRSVCRQALPPRSVVRVLLNAYSVAQPVRTVERARSDWLLGLGQALERDGRGAEALSCYRRCGEHPWRERLVRLLHRRRRLLARDGLLAQLRVLPLCPDEAQFAERFPGRFPALPTPTTIWQSRLTSAERGALGTTQAEALGVEQRCAEALTANGGVAWHLENRLPRMLFGLIYWDAIFAPVPEAFVHPFQRAPLDISWRDFYPRREVLFEQLRRQAIAAGPRWLLDSWQAHAGSTNAFVGWRRSDANVIEVLLRSVPMRVLVAIADIMAREPGQARVGFPDLTVVYGSNCFEFVEVKGPGDQLQTGQRLWLRALSGAGVPARVLRVKAAPGRDG